MTAIWLAACAARGPSFSLLYATHAQRHGKKNPLPVQAVKPPFSLPLLDCSWSPRITAWPWLIVFGRAFGSVRTQSGRAPSGGREKQQQQEGRAAAYNKSCSNKQ